MRPLISLLTAFLIVLVIVACNNSTSPDTEEFDPFSATVYLGYATDTPYNIFNVIESDSYEEPEINIHYGEYLDNHPNKKDTIENDTINVDVLPYISDYGSKRYRLLEINL